MRGQVIKFLCRLDLYICLHTFRPNGEERYQGVLGKMLDILNLVSERQDHVQDQECIVVCTDGCLLSTCISKIVHLNASFVKCLSWLQNKKQSLIEEQVFQLVDYREKVYVQLLLCFFQSLPCFVVSPSKLSNFIKI